MGCVYNMSCMDKLKIYDSCLQSAHARPISFTYFILCSCIYSPYTGYNYSYLILSNCMGSSYTGCPIEIHPLFITSRQKRSVRTKPIVQAVVKRVQRSPRRSMRKTASRLQISRSSKHKIFKNG